MFKARTLSLLRLDLHTQLLVTTMDEVGTSYGEGVTIMNYVLILSCVPVAIVPMERAARSGSGSRTHCGLLCLIVLLLLRSNKLDFILNYNGAIFFPLNL